MVGLPNTREEVTFILNAWPRLLG